MADEQTTPISLWDRVRSRVNMHANCRNCGIAFNIRDPIPGVRFSERSTTCVNGASPVCQICFDQLTAGEVAQCFRELWAEEWPYQVDEDAVDRFRENAHAIKTGEGSWMTEEGLEAP